jgi:hypothetical protein
MGQEKKIDIKEQWSSWKTNIWQIEIAELIWKK